MKLDTFEVKESDGINSSISVPSNITTKDTTWDSITLTWNAVEGASFYQIELNGSKFWEASTTNSITKRGLLPETEHTFRVRAVRGNSVSEWSDVVKGITEKKPFEGSLWKRCPDNVYENRKYSVDEENPRIATNINGGWCTIIGNTPLPLNKVTWWNIKILESYSNNGYDIYIGVAPSDIDQNTDKPYFHYGWYFYCFSSTLISGYPGKYRGEEYGPRKRNGYYVNIGDNVGVVMDTTKGKNGKLSFVLNRVDLGVAYERIPLNKPLVPCVILNYQGDSVELVI